MNEGEEWVKEKNWIERMSEKNEEMEKKIKRIKENEEMETYREENEGED